MFLGYLPVQDRLQLAITHLPKTTKMNIGRGGGTISLLGNDIQLKIPEAALEKEVEIELSIISPNEMCPPLGDKQFVIAPIIRCKPEGLRFLKPVKLTFPHCGINITTKHIRIWRKDKGNYIRKIECINFST